MTTLPWCGCHGQSDGRVNAPPRACPVGSQDIVGHAGYWTLRPGRAELALAVADRCQGRVLGRLLLDAITDVAVDHGLCALEMEVLPGNHAVLGLLSRGRWPVYARLTSGVILCELCLTKTSSTPSGPAAISTFMADERLQVGPFANVRGQRKT